MFGFVVVVTFQLMGQRFELVYAIDFVQAEEGENTEKPMRNGGGVPHNWA